MLRTYDNRKMLKALTVESTDQPAMIWYCKAFLKDGQTIVIDYIMNGQKYRVRTDDWESDGASLRMNMNNTKGKAKAAGAKCALLVKSGTIQLIGRVVEEQY
jgi:hypothetical protein